MRSLIVPVLALAAACGFANLFAADAPRIAVPPLAQIEESSDPGLKLTIEAGGIQDVRTARLVALRVPADQPASPFVEPGPFKATWEGAIQLRIKSDYNFSAIGRGTLKLTINDQVALDITGDDFAGKPGPTVKLKKGKNTLKAEYTSPKEGDASIRLLWSAKEFLPESVPPTVLVHDGADQPLREQQRVRQGRELVANLRCLKCHTSDVTAAGGSMRELSADTPSLLDVGQRFTQSWLAHWINNPHSMRADTEMPRLFHAPENQIDQGARDIAAYLVESSAKAEPVEDTSSEELVNQGTRLFATLGCAGCHVLPGQEPAPDAPVRISLKYVAQKFQPGALKAFLLKPETHYQWIRMPNFRLSDAEATALSAFLRSRKTDELASDTAGDATRGKELFQSAGCISCHSSKVENKAKAPAFSEIAKSDFTRGCISKDAEKRGKAPDYELTDDRRGAILAFAATDGSSLKRDTTAEFAERQVVALNCTGCHSRDKQDDNWSTVSAEVDALTKALPAEDEKPEGEFSGDQSRPPLTWVGEKLRPQWSADFIAGTLKYKPRPWLRARMPGFASRAKPLAQGLALSHGCPPSAPSQAKSDPALAEVGKKLVSKAGGFSCIQCHGVADQKPLAPFEAPAINFAHVSERLNREYYDRWVYNPQRVLPGTRMPQFADYEGHTALKDTLGGDGKKQFDAIWNYLLLGSKITPP